VVESGLLLLLPTHCHCPLRLVPPPHLPTPPTPNRAAAAIGGLRGARQQAGSGRGGGRNSREVTEFLEDAVGPGGGSRSEGGGAAGRGSGSYERFIKAHKEVVLSEEDRRFKTWSSWRESQQDDDDLGDE
jgi:hypothetical protein